MQTQPRRMILASASPRRRQLLSSFGLPFSVIASGIDEQVEDETRPSEMVIRLAERKAQAVATGLNKALVIGANTTVVIDGQVLNKPVDAADAWRLLGLLRGRTHEVWTGVAVVDAASGRIETSAVRSLVRMRAFTDTTIETYVATGEPLDKAGAYAIQGGAGTFVKHIEGCYNNVVGLPLCELALLLKRFEFEIGSNGAVCTDSDGAPCPQCIG